MLTRTLKTKYKYTNKENIMPGLSMSLCQQLRPEVSLRQALELKQELVLAQKMLMKLSRMSKRNKKAILEHYALTYILKLIKRNEI